MATPVYCIMYIYAQKLSFR